MRAFTSNDFARLFGFDADQARKYLSCTRRGARECLLHRYNRGSMRGPDATADPGWEIPDVYPELVIEG